MYSDIENFSLFANPIYVDSVGYINLFPIIAELIPTDSQKLGYIFDTIKNENALWSDYGLRSLSKSDFHFGTGEDYWKGRIWININYLVLSALHNKYIKDGPYSKQAEKIYTQLRDNIVTNMEKIFRKTRFFWESYHPITGEGVGVHPFNGWSSLALLIMTEKY